MVKNNKAKHMEDLIERLTVRLENVNKLVTSKQKTGRITFRDISIIDRFFIDFQEINRLIDFAVRRARSNIDTLRNETLKLDKQLSVYLALDMNSWQTKEKDSETIEAMNVLAHKIKKITEAILGDIDSLKNKCHE